MVLAAAAVEAAAVVTEGKEQASEGVAQGILGRERPVVGAVVRRPPMAVVVPVGTVPVTVVFPVSSPRVTVGVVAVSVVVAAMVAVAVLVMRVTAMVAVAVLVAAMGWCEEDAQPRRGMISGDGGSWCRRPYESCCDHERGNALD